MRAILIAVGFALALAAPGVAQSEPRLALLIGNESYPGDPPSLRRPHDDVATLRAALEEVGFEVSVVLDADAAAIEDAVSAFGEALAASGEEAVGFFYYAGHGAVASSGGERRNFMIPAGVSVSSAIQVAQRGVRLDRQIDALENAGASALFVVYDACRNSFTRGGRGFTVETQRPGLLVAMSTMADATTPDDGAYAVALAEEITRPGQRAENAFINASQLVGRGRPSTELPTVAPALREAFCFSGCGEAEESSGFLRTRDVDVTEAEARALADAVLAVPTQDDQFLNEVRGFTIRGRALMHRYEEYFRRLRNLVAATRQDFDPSNAYSDDEFSAILAPLDEGVDEWRANSLADVEQLETHLRAAELIMEAMPAGADDQTRQTLDFHLRELEASNNRAMQIEDQFEYLSQEVCGRAPVSLIRGHYCVALFVE